MEKYTFKTAQTYLSDFFGISIDTIDFENIGMYGWDEIGNKAYKFYTMCGKLENGRIKLPCNVDIIESVTSEEIEWIRPLNKSNVDYTGLTIETTLDSYDTIKSPYDVGQKYINYTIDDEYLYAEADTINILYKGLVLDDDGLPLLNSKEVKAIATYVAWVHTQKQGMITKDQVLLQMAQVYKKDWIRAKNTARVPEYMNQNDFNEVLEVRSSWDRKRHGISYKPIRK